MDGTEESAKAGDAGLSGLETFMEELLSTLGGYLPRVLGVLGLLLVGWLAALLVRALLRRALKRFKINQRVWSVGSKATDVEGGIAAGAYYTVWALVLMAAFNALNLEVASEPLKELIGPIFGFVPRLVAAGVLTLVAWLLATMAREGVAKALGLTSWEKDLKDHAGVSPISQSLGQVCYWLVLLIFVPGVLEVLGLSNLLDPIQAMITQGLLMLPNLFGAGLIAVVGWYTAMLLRNILTNLLATAGADDFGKRLGLGQEVKLSELVGRLVQVMIVLPAFIAALDTLQIEAISRPATNMLQTLMLAVPNILAASAILAVTFLAAGLVTRLMTALLERLGFDSLPQRLGLSAEAAERIQPSASAGKALYFFVILMAVTEAANLLGFEQLSDLVTMFIQFGGQVLLGAAILLVGYMIARAVYQTIEKIGGPSALMAARIARVAIMGLVVAMGLRAMGVADNIVDLAFGLTLGAVAVAFALSFGLGGRQAAGQLMSAWLRKLHPEDDDNAPKA